MTGLRRIWPALLAMVMLLPAAGPAQARPRTALRVRTLSRAPASAGPGASFSVTYKVTRTGSGLKRASLRFYLSPKVRKAAGALRLASTRPLGGLVRKKAVKGRAKLTVPAAAHGSYRLLACVEKVKLLGRRTLSAPCRASAGKVVVGAFSDAVVLPSPPTPPGPGPVAPVATPTPTPTPEPIPPDGDGVDPATPLAGAHALSVTPHTDAARAAAATIGPGGGTLNATGADGTAYKLTVPAGALLADEPLSMTPLSSIDGLPFDSLVGAVDLQPDGLILSAPVTLEITPSGAAPALPAQSFFAYAGAGEDFHNYPPVADSSKLAIQLTHFTGGGVASGTDAQRAAVDERTPVQYIAQYEAELSGAARSYRSGAITGEQFIATYVGVAEQYYSHVARPRLQAATTDDSLAVLAMATFNAWAKEINASGMTPWMQTELQEGYDLTRATLRNAYTKTFARCVNHDIAQIKRMQAVAQLAAKLGAGVGDEDFNQKVEGCLRFKLDLGIDLKRQGSQPHDFVRLLASSSDALLEYDIGKGQVRGDVPLTVDDFNWGDRICFKDGGDATPIDPALAIVALDVNLHIERLPNGGSAYVSDPPKLSLTLDPGNINTRSQCAVDADPGHPEGNGGTANRFYLQAMHSQFGTKETVFISPLTAWTVHPVANPWGSLFAPSPQPYLAGLSLTLKHEPLS